MAELRRPALALRCNDAPDDVEPNRDRQAVPEPYGNAEQRVQPTHTRPTDESEGTLAGVVAYNRYGGYLVPLAGRHRAAARKVLAGKVWEPHTLRFLRSHWHHGDLVHAGMFFGDFLPGLTSHCPEGSKIWAFEPNPENFRCAQVTALLNHAGPELAMFNAGVGETESTSALRWRNRAGRKLGGASRVVDEKASDDPERAVTVRIVSLDDVIPADRDVTIIQLDVEGYEARALRGALRTIERCRPVLVLETVPDDPRLLDRLHDLGYRTRRTVDLNTVLRARPRRPVS
jgi:FkbM family methyltransferase